MPIYKFKNKVTGESFSELMSISAMEDYISKNPDLEIDITEAFPGIHSGIGLGLRKPDEGFKDLLTEAKKSSAKRGGKINDWR